MSFCNVKDFYFQSTLDRIGAKPPVDSVTSGDKCFESTCFHFSHFSRKMVVASSTGLSGWCRKGSPWCGPVLQGLMESHPALLVSDGQHSSWSQAGNLRLGIAVRLHTTAICFMGSSRREHFGLGRIFMLAAHESKQRQASISVAKENWEVLSYLPKVLSSFKEKKRVCM